MSSSVIGWLGTGPEYYLPVAPDCLRLDQPLDEDLWNGQGLLLLAKGQRIQSEAQLKWLRALPAMHRIDPQDPAFPGGLRARSPEELALPHAWQSIHASLDGLLASPAGRKDFSMHLERVCGVARHHLDRLPDRSLFMLVQMLAHGGYGYCAANALACAAIVHRMAPALGLPAATRDALLRAALTMNIGMSVLQDQLAQQEAPVSEAQREEIAAHPQAGVALLRSFGITDPLWLEIVRQHHDAPEGSPADVLHVADLCVARISPRRTRSALSPADALRLFYADHATEPSPLARTLLAEVGMFPPGSYVHLASNETAVVTGLGQGDVPPPVLALADRNNEPLVPPRQRDTGDIRYRIRESLAPDLVPPGCAVGARLFDYF